MTKSTIARLILIIIVIINLILKSLGMDLIQIGEAEIFEAVELIIEIAIIVVAAWKNNSVTAKAIEADIYLKKLKNGK